MFRRLPVALALIGFTVLFRPAFGQVSPESLRQAIASGVCPSPAYLVNELKYEQECASLIDRPCNSTSNACYDEKQQCWNRVIAANKDIVAYNNWIKQCTGHAAKPPADKLSTKSSTRSHNGAWTSDLDSRLQRVDNKKKQNEQAIEQQKNAFVQEHRQKVAVYEKELADQVKAEAKRLDDERNKKQLDAAKQWHCDNENNLTLCVMRCDRFINDWKRANVDYQFGPPYYRGQACSSVCEHRPSFDRRCYHSSVLDVRDQAGLDRFKAWLGGAKQSQVTPSCRQYPFWQKTVSLYEPEGREWRYNCKVLLDDLAEKGMGACKCD